MELLNVNVYNYTIIHTFANIFSSFCSERKKFIKGGIRIIKF